MSRSRIAQRIAFCLALGLVAFVPSFSRADTITIQHPFNSYTSTPASLSVVNGISIANNGAASPSTTFFGTLDIKNNDIIIKSPVQTYAGGLANFQNVMNMVRAGADQGAYDGAGITSSTINLDATQGNGGLAIGVMYNDDGGAVNGDGSGNPIWGGANSDLGSWDGYTNISQYDTLVKYTFIGDLFLEGFVTGTDVSVVFPNLNQTFGNTGPLDQTWQSGDFFYQNASGTPIGGVNYSVAFANLSNQNTYPYNITLAQQGGGNALAVPEPSSIIVAGMGVLGVIGYSIRRRS